MPIEDKYLLMELPISKPHQMGDIKPIEEFRKVLAMGLTPLLPHPERYFYLSRKELVSFAEAGVKIQCNYGSLAGLYGEKVRQNVQSIMDEGIVSFFGTDLHNAHYVEVLNSINKCDMGCFRLAYFVTCLSETFYLSHYEQNLQNTR